MGNKKKDVDVKELMLQNELKRKQRQLEKLQLDSAIIIHKEITRYRT
jgi:hypothetical protein